MDRRFLIASGLAALGTSACTTTGSGDSMLISTPTACVAVTS